ncbi:MAG: hypothetical protein M1445_11000 [Bacteroidetes bacterium]|nr:hypothetical protein [Bacteroidota bacterium]MCL6103301.1 hypothetical protein [Bacteroidota bacterium]
MDLTDETVFDYLKNISQSILFRDVVSRFEVRNVDFLVRLIKYLANETGNLISARGIGNSLKSQNIPISITAILKNIYIQVALRIAGKQTMEREFGNLMAIKDNYPKYVITLDDYSGTSYEGIILIPLRKFLFRFLLDKATE